MYKLYKNLFYAKTHFYTVWPHPILFTVKVLWNCFPLFNSLQRSYNIFIFYHIEKVSWKQTHCYHSSAVFDHLVIELNNYNSIIFRFLSYIYYWFFVAFRYNGNFKFSSKCVLTNNRLNIFSIIMFYVLQKYLANFIEMLSETMQCTLTWKKKNSKINFQKKKYCLTDGPPIFFI